MSNFYPLRSRPLDLRPDNFRPGSLIITVSVSDSVVFSDSLTDDEAQAVLDAITFDESIIAFLSANNLLLADAIAFTDSAAGWVFGAETGIGETGALDANCWPADSEVDIS